MGGEKTIRYRIERLTSLAGTAAAGGSAAAGQAPGRALPAPLRCCCSGSEETEPPSLASAPQLIWPEPNEPGPPPSGPRLRNTPSRLFCSVFPRFLPPFARTHHSRLSLRRGSSAPCPTAQRPLAAGDSSLPVLRHAGTKSPGRAARPRRRRGLSRAVPPVSGAKPERAGACRDTESCRGGRSASRKRREEEERGGGRRRGERPSTACGTAPPAERPGRGEEPGEQRGTNAAPKRRGVRKEMESEARSGRSGTQSDRAGSAAGERVTRSAAGSLPVPQHGSRHNTVPAPRLVAARGAQANGFRVWMPPQ